MIAPHYSYVVRGSRSQTFTEEKQITPYCYYIIYVSRSKTLTDKKLAEYVPRPIKI